MSKLGLDRQILAQITTNHRAIKALEQVFTDVGSTLPTTIEEAAAQAVQALAVANSVLGTVADLAAQLEVLVAASTRAGLTPEADDFAPSVQLGTMSKQNSDAVDITGGTIGLDAGTVTDPSFYLVDRTTGFYRSAANTWAMSISGVDMVTYSSTGALFKQNVSTEKQLISSIVTGTAPLQVASTTLVANLHAAVADELDGPSAYPPDATDLPTALTLLNAVKANLISKKV